MRDTLARLFALAGAVFLLAVLIVFLLFVFYVFRDALSPEAVERYHQQQARYEFQQRDAIVQECLASERYSREECIALAGQEGR